MNKIQLNEFSTMDDVRKFMIIFRNTKNSVRSVPLTTGKRKKNELSGRCSASTTEKTKETFYTMTDADAT